MGGANFDPNQPPQYPAQFPPPPPPPPPGGIAPPSAGWQQAAGLSNFGAPPPPPPEGWQPSKPTSGKAIAGLILGIAAPILGFGCPPLLIAVPVGFVLSLFAIGETGKEGKRSGRGLAIAATILCSLAIVGGIGLVGFMINQARFGREAADEMLQAEVDKDIDLVAKRLQEYHRANGSLAPGGPFLAGSGYVSENVPRDNKGAERGANVAGVKDGKVQTALTMRHLVRETDLSAFKDFSHYELTVTGDNQARLLIKGWSNEVMQEIEISDAANARWHRRD